MCMVCVYVYVFVYVYKHVHVHVYVYVYAYAYVYVYVYVYVCVCVCVFEDSKLCVLCMCIEKHWERFFENNRDKQLRQVRTNKPTSKEQTQNSMNKNWEK